MTNIYYFAAWTDSGCLLGCDHEHKTVAEALDCDSEMRNAGSYVVAVENGLPRALNDEEEAEFQRAPRKSPPQAVLQCEASGYAVMLRVRLADGWGWTTWMRWETYEQALAHANGHQRIVPFGSAEWHALRQRRDPPLPAPVPAPQRSQPRRRDGETLVEFVSRLVPSERDPYALPVTSEPIRPAGTKAVAFVDLVLEWISKWEVKAIERIYMLQVEALRRKVRKVLKHKTPTR